MSPGREQEEVRLAFSKTFSVTTGESCLSGAVENDIAQSVMARYAVFVGCASEGVIAKRI